MLAIISELAGIGKVIKIKEEKEKTRNSRIV